MKSVLILLILGTVACGESMNEEKNENNGIQNNGVGNNGQRGNNGQVSNSLNGLNGTEATTLCEKYIASGGFVKCDNGNSPKYVTVAECSGSFAQLPSCFKETHVAQCAAGLCAGGATPLVCDALLSGQCPKDDGNNKNNDGKKGSACHVGGAAGEASNAFTQKIGNSTECEYKASASDQLSCLYDTGSKKGTCEYICSQSDKSCPSGLSCTTLGKKNIADENWSACR